MSMFYGVVGCSGWMKKQRAEANRAMVYVSEETRVECEVLARVCIQRCGIQKHMEKNNMKKGREYDGRDGDDDGDDVHREAAGSVGPCGSHRTVLLTML